MVQYERTMRSFSTPMMQQYMHIKEQYPDCLLFFRLGDFYELFLDDALIGARLLNITLTRRPRGKDGNIPMAGVPYHAAENYIAKLIHAGQRVAICEQVSEPDAKGIVERSVVRVITPGTVLDDTTLEAKKHNYLASCVRGDRGWGVAFLDLLTGECMVTFIEHSTEWGEQVRIELTRFSPSELLASQKEIVTLNIGDYLQECGIQVTQQPVLDHSQAIALVTQHFDEAVVNELQLGEEDASIKAVARICDYLQYTQRQIVRHLKKPIWYNKSEYVQLDQATITNLELFKNLHGDEQLSLLALIDRTRTGSGGRLLCSWLSRPLYSYTGVTDRQKAVSFFVSERQLRVSVRHILEELYDSERIISKLALKAATPSLVWNLATTLEKTLQLSNLLANVPRGTMPLWSQLPKKKIEKIVADIKGTLVEKGEDSESAIIRSGVSTELDRMREITQTGATWIREFEAQERKRTGIPSLKCKYNQVFGYSIEISHAHKASIPSDYERKQTLVSAERFTTPQLKEREVQIISAAARISELENLLFSELVERVVSMSSLVQLAARAVAELDVFTAFAHLAEEEEWIMPELHPGRELHIEGGKHPVLALHLKEKCIANSTELGIPGAQVVIITGPNMGGKSVYMRQVALITLLTHIGAPVPARSARIPLTDALFVRSGASDNIAAGVSTFMMEMTEAARIVTCATSKSLVVMDEIGRGTSTYDGISIAWALAESFVIGTEQPKVLFATHYHELQELAQHYSHAIQNRHAAVYEDVGKPVFLYTIDPGPASHSYGIAVAELAKIPEPILGRARTILQKLEKNHEPQDGSLLSAKLLKLDCTTLKPIDALTFLASLQDELRKSA